MVMVTASQIGPPSIHSQQSIHHGLPVAATANPGRSETWNVPRDIYPKSLDGGNYYVTIDKEYPDLRCVYYKDGTFIGHTTHGNKGETEWPRIIDKHKQELADTTVSSVTRTEYEASQKDLCMSASE